MEARTIDEALRQLREKHGLGGTEKKKPLTRVEKLFAWKAEMRANRKRIREKYGPRIEFDDALALLFLGLKLAGSIHWNWAWVFAPWWGGIVVFTLIVIGAAVMDAVSPLEGVE